MGQLPPGTQKKEQMWALPLDILRLARETHMQTLNERGIISEQSDPTVKSMHGVLPIPCRGSRMDKGMEDAPCPLRVWYGRADNETNTVQDPQVQRRNADWLCPKGLWFNKLRC